MEAINFWSCDYHVTLRIIFSFVSEKIELMLGETKLVQLIHLFRGKSNDMTLLACLFKEFQNFNFFHFLQTIFSSTRLHHRESVDRTHETHLLISLSPSSLSLSLSPLPPFLLH